MNKALLFVYNAKSDILSKYLDSIHKIVSPDTYSCALCSLTHGSFSEKKMWKSYRENSDFEFEFMYKNMFLKMYSDTNHENLNFPVVLQKQKDGFIVLFDAKKLTSLRSVEELIDLIKKKKIN